MKGTIRSIRTDGKTWPWPKNEYVRKLFKLGFRLREWLVRNVEISDGDSRYRFLCRTFPEFSRSMKFFIKEPGTCDWIKNEVKPGDVFYDIGANIGIYTILAAHYAGDNGRVYAFEPHSANFTRLLDNIRVNSFEHIVKPCNFALHDKQGFFPFNYASGKAGTAESQLASVIDAHKVEFQPEISELKYAVPVDELVSAEEFLPPQHIKIDVDGNELLILQGMSKLLDSPGRPKTIQVEINKPYKDGILAFMSEHGYYLSDRHYTRYGLELIDKGNDPEDHSYNAIFRPSAEP
ncbi:MAG: hypothetical protein BMS9Abin06_0761 [Gammaproteobacteria bacterium]|nr:MAG: hypothetical protein BMS9Abin06_0761 [Gammaproteobacteria bacterium]